ncbi:MAG: 2-methylcitrate dehydratase [Betaproteobacteria bacterium]|nr:2-methylcitrate dehydratase [Betaproteobacteria bacterium]
MTGITRTLARFAAHSKFDALPAAVKREGTRAFVNWVGCAAGGSQEDAIQRSLDVLTEFNGAASSTVIGRREKLDALNATFINSMSSAALAYNDTHYTTVAHPTSPVGAVLLALAERQPISGKDFVHALVIGNEIQCRVGGILVTPPAESAIGLSMAGLVGCIGAAVSAGMILGFDENVMTATIGLAANQSAGLRETHASNGSQYIQGHTARCGLMAAFLAARGFTCNDSGLEGPKGFGVSFASKPQFDIAVQQLGEQWEISSLAYKPYPSGFVIHPVTDACLEIAQKNSYDPAQIERIELLLNPLAVQLTSRPTPTTRNQAMVSLQHWTAVSLIYKAAGIAQLADSILRDPLVAATRAKTVMKTDDAVGREAATARIVFKDGKALEATVKDCRGSARRPLTDDDISVKTLDQLSVAFSKQAAERIVAECWKLEQYPRVDVLAKTLGAA